MAVASQIRSILVKIDTAGARDLKTLAESLGLVNKNTKQLADGFADVAAISRTFFGGFALKELAGLSDEIQNIQGRLIAFTGDLTEANTAFSGIVQIARETNATLASTADGFTRMSLAVQSAGLSQKTLLEFTKVISNTFRLSGASTDEAANATIQLSQAFSLGTLRGQDLRSVMSQNVVLTQILKKEFGNELLKAAEKGLITVPKIFELLAKNMEDVNTKADKIKTTFGQSFQKIFDAFKIQIFQLSDALGGSSLFSKGADLLIENMGYVVAIGTVLAATTLPAMVTGILGAAGAIGILNVAAITFTGPWLALIAALKLAGVQFSDLGTIFFAGYNRIAAIFKDLSALSNDFNAALASEGPVKDRFERLAAQARAAAKEYRTLADAAHEENEFAKQSAKDQETQAEAQRRRLEDLAKSLSLLPAKTAQEEFAALNKQFLKDGDIDKYNQALNSIQIKKFTERFREGKDSIFTYNKALRENFIAGFNRELRLGIITFEEYKAKVDGAKLDELNERFVTGKTTLIEYNKELLAIGDKFQPGSALVVGAANYIESVGTLSQGVAGAITRTFSTLEDSLVDFVTTGKFNFKNFAKSVLDDLTRIIIRASIISPLAQGLLGSAIDVGGTGSLAAGPGTSGGQNTFAKGGAFYGGNVIPFAKGGIVGSPTNFGMSGGRMGLMGEAGPEAILPLSRGDGGRLGVQATVTPVNINIINNSGSEVTQTESTGPNGERTIEVIIAGKVRDGIMNGKFDTAFKSSFGLQRKGS